MWKKNSCDLVLPELIQFLLSKNVHFLYFVKGGGMGDGDGGVDVKVLSATASMDLTHKCTLGNHKWVLGSKNRSIFHTSMNEIYPTRF